MLAAVTYPPFVSASRWQTIVAQLRQVIEAKRGKSAYPALRNGDVVRLVVAWLAALGTAQRIRAHFPLWHQYAGVAYGWDPKRDVLTASAKQRDAAYPAPLVAEFWKAQTDLARALDAANEPQARLDLDGEFSDVVFQREVQHALREDGAKASFAIPVPACRGPNGGTVLAKCKRYSTKWPYLCEEYEACKPVVVIDPITDIKRKSDNALLLVALIVAAWAVYENQPRQRRN